jgi:Transposase IS116/IS110/IS902 family
MGQNVPNLVCAATALTWALEVGDAQRFSSIKKAISYCGLCGTEKGSANIVQRTPLSKQRNKHLQTTLIEAAKMAPRYSPNLAMLYDKEKQKGNANRATIAVARKLVAYLTAIDVVSGFSGGGNELHRCVKRGGEQGGFLRRVACQVLPSSRPGEGAQALDAPVDKFRDWQETQTQSSVQLRSGSNLEKGTTAERPTHAARNQN